MKRIIPIILLISIMVYFCSCGSRLIGGDDYLEYFSGKVIEIKDKHTVLIQITEERGGYKVDDKVYVHYDEAILQDKTIEFDNSNGLLDSDYKVLIDDEIYAQSIVGEHENLNGYDYRENCGSIIVYGSAPESSEN